MSPLKQAALDKAVDAFLNDDGTTCEGVAAAIEAYLEEAFKPGEPIVGEPLEVIPQRDYRKELWIEAWKANGSSVSANAALQQFDMTFGAAK